MTNRPPLELDSESDHDESSSTPQRKSGEDPCFPEVLQNDVHVCIWGTPSAGKTTFMGMLWHACQPDSKDKDKWIMTPKNPDTQRWITDLRITLNSGLRFPDATVPQRPKQLLFEMQSNDLENPIEFTLTFIEAAGEMYANPENFAQTYNCEETPVDYLRRCSGIVMLVDQDVKKEYHALISTLEKLRINPKSTRAEPIAMPIAFCLTKCDQVNLRHLIEAEDSSKATEHHIRQEFPSELINNTTNPLYIRQSKWYPISAVGYVPGKLPNFHRRYDSTYGLKTYPTPINILEPLKWVMQQLDV